MALYQPFAVLGNCMQLNKCFISLLSRLFMGVGIISLISACSPLFSETFPYSLEPETDVGIKPMKIKILSSKGLRLKDNNGNKISELSGIAWDRDENRLYAVSDEGMLYHLSVEVHKNNMRYIKVIKTYRLLSRERRRLRGKWSDSEGLSLLKGSNGISGDTELIVAFENKPRVARYSVKGKFLGDVKLPKKLWHKKKYRHKNKALESVSVHPQYGVLTAAEYPLKKQAMSLQTIYSSRGREWSFKASSAKNSAITGLEILPNGHMLVLERAWSGIKRAIVISLSEVNLTQCGGKKICEVITLASLSSRDGWMLDNFEGLAHYESNQYFMVSDDNESAFQSTVLVLFEIGG